MVTGKLDVIDKGAECYETFKKAERMFFSIFARFN
ncbi:hypothetical protein protein [Bacillus cereus G9241]|nr:hypothetical protein protein [Bacillus cereus G9241]